MVVKVRPPHVEAAVYCDDLNQLRISGSAGGRKSAEVRRKRETDREAMKAYFREKLENEECLRRLSTNEHIVPFDPEAAENHQA